MTTITSEFLQEEQFQNQLQEIIRNGDPNTMTTKLIRQQLEDYFSLDRDSLKEFKDTLNQKIGKVYEALENNDKEQSTNDKKRKVENQTGDTDPDSPEPSKKSKTNKKKTSPVIKSDTEEEEEEEEEEEDNEEDDETFSQSSPPPAPKKPRKKRTPKPKPIVPIIKHTATPAEADTIKKLKQFITKCGVRKVWARELSTCHSAEEEITKLRGILTDLGVTGRPSLERCEQIKKERELKAEVSGLDTSLILKDKSERGSRLRSRAQNRPSYKIEDSSEEEESDDEEEGDENDENGEPKKRSKKKANSDDEGAEPGEEEEDDNESESSGDEFRDSSGDEE